MFSWLLFERYSDGKAKRHTPRRVKSWVIYQAEQQVNTRAIHTANYVDFFLKLNNSSISIQLIFAFIATDKIQYIHFSYLKKIMQRKAARLGKKCFNFISFNQIYCITCKTWRTLSENNMFQFILIILFTFCRSSLLANTFHQMHFFYSWFVK